MIWKEVSPGIHTSDLDNWTITRIHEYQDIYKNDHYTFIAVKGNQKISTNKVHKRMQTTLF